MGIAPDYKIEEFQNDNISGFVLARSSSDRIDSTLLQDSVDLFSVVELIFLAANIPKFSCEIVFQTLNNLYYNKIIVLKAVIASIVEFTLPKFNKP